MFRPGICAFKALRFRLGLVCSGQRYLRESAAVASWNPCLKSLDIKEKLFVRPTRCKINRLCEN